MLRKLKVSCFSANEIKNIISFSIYIKITANAAGKYPTNNITINSKIGFTKYSKL